MTKTIVFACLIIGAVLFCDTASAEHYTDAQIANAIYKAENSRRHPYGILKHYRHTTPRQACINTIRHARKDWNGKGDFIAFLACRYAPVGCSNDPRNLNCHWLKNVRHFLKKEA